MTSVLGVIQCRFSSSRLPGKCLRELAGLPLLEWVIRRMQRSKALSKLVLATTDMSADDPVAELGEALDIPVVRGEVDDLLARYMRVLDSHPAEITVRITADNPLTCPDWMDRQIAWFVTQGHDYTQLQDCPYGSGTDTFSSDGLRLACREADAKAHREHINQFFLTQPSRFKLGAMELPGMLRRPDVRVTVDTPHDFQRMEALFGQLADPLAASLADMIAAYDSLPAALRAAPPSAIT